ncbi:MAG: RNA polymerase sigma factor [Candidatus Zixiibacteriota bacterium]|nr:MAG: RNA polymerase sigma factor [candidate division Zixibacteria bacterium]
MNLNLLHELAQNGDSRSEDRLFESMSARFRLFVQQKIYNRQDAEEVVQKALMTIAEKYRGLKFKTSFSAWAYEVLKNKVLDYWKAGTFRQKRIIDYLDEMETERTVEPNPNLERKLLDCFKQVSTTNRRHARILNLHYQGYHVKDICKMLNLTTSNFYSILFRARSMLADCLRAGGVI